MRFKTATLYFTPEDVASRRVKKNDKSNPVFITECLILPMSNRQNLTNHNPTAMDKSLSRVMLKSSIIAALTAVCAPVSAYTHPDSTLWHDPSCKTQIIHEENHTPALLYAVPSTVFFTDSKEIKTRATTDDAGRLYHVDRDGVWHLCRPANTAPYLTYHAKATHGASEEYRYYPPLTHHVSHIEIGTESGATFRFAAADSSRPIIVFCSDDTEAGVEWITDMQRNLDLPTAIMTISCVGKTDTAITALTKQTTARLYILDFTDSTDTDPRSYAATITGVISETGQNSPATPILVVSDSKVIQAVCDSINHSTSATIHYLPTPDARRRASSVETKVREILGMRQGNAPTCVEVSQRRDIGAYDWHQRHHDICHYIDSARPSNLIIGNSIVHYWGGKPGNIRVHGPETWRTTMEPEGFVNMGCGWDKIENVLWRVYHGELDGTDAENIVVMIGTNNIAFNTPDEIAEGIGHLVEAIETRQPDARIILAGLLPRRNLEPTVATINRLLEQIAKDKGARYINPGIMMLQSDGKIDESLFIDGLHPNDKGYAIIAPQIVAAMKRKK